MSELDVFLSKGRWVKKCDSYITVGTPPISGAIYSRSNQNGNLEVLTIAQFEGFNRSLAILEFDDGNRCRLLGEGITIEKLEKDFDRKSKWPYDFEPFNERSGNARVLESAKTGKAK